MAKFNRETVLDVQRWTDNLFSFRTTRDTGFRFESGMFVMIGLEVEGRPLLRAYSLASPAYAEHLEFLSIVVENGPLTSRLQHIKPGDEILVGHKPTGTLLLDNLDSGRNLYLLATGTGLAAFMGIVQEPDAYERFEKVVLIHGVRNIAELAYRDFFTSQIQNDEYIGELAKAQLVYVPTVTREPFERQGRIPDHLVSDAFYDSLGLPKLDPARDRVMVCGSTAMLKDLAALLEGMGFEEGSNAKRGQFVVEKAFADQTPARATAAAE
ncbi:ferredoxin--NADP reductase [Asticcacaulis sp. AC402]|uniref:ferredoxin--NADP reductase n=1 Tax=Asticcacaulis sp. AC402 TaxID=1282361 RepID=UPI0003C40E56|nr:ferredoxin--NADP reductase [Asticcacaulis sp. AC402]ESQ76180.1 ferredoxin--NADP reductase [Asticcacaulis sp. AC402]